MTEFKATDYSTVTRRELIDLVGDGSLSWEDLLEISKLEPNKRQDEDFYVVRVRRVIRYCISRVKNMLEGGSEIPPFFENFLDQYSEHFVFKLVNGFEGYGVSWDISEQAPYEMVILEESFEEKWNKVIMEQAIPIEDVLFKEQKEQ